MSKNILSADIVLDEEAFSKAVAGLSDIAAELNGLKEDIDQMLDELIKGFNTPAGVQFVTLGKESLIKTLDKQSIVIEHVSNTLNKSKAQYKKVFDKYGELEALIKNL